MIEGPAEARGQIRAESGKEAAAHARIAQGCNPLQLPGCPRPGHVIQVAGQNGWPTPPPNLPGHEPEFGITIASIVAGPMRPWMHPIELHMIAGRQSNPCGD